MHLCNGLDPRRDGGMVPSILGMAGSLAARGERISIATPTPSRLDGVDPHPALPIRGPISDIEAEVAGAELVHMHGLWQGHTRRGSAAARRHRVPYVITAHGMAEPWALRHKAWKKRIYTTFIEGKNLRRADCLHALSRPEISHLRALAPRATVAFIPNGVDLAPFDHLPSRDSFDDAHPRLRGKFLLIFLGRLHVKKGLDLLAGALEALAPSHPELHLLLAGHDDGALVPFLDRIRDQRLDDRVTCLGHVSGESARAAWGAADAFILPSYSEGFSMAILEALAARLPAVITTACHFPELDSVQGAITVEPTCEDVTNGVRSLLGLSPSERGALGRRGRELVERDYTWERQGERLASVYRWVVAGGPVPDAILQAE